MGESAGAYSTCAQLATPGARGLFDKAILQSRPCTNALLGGRVAEPSTGTVGTLPLGACHGVEVPYFFDSRFTGPTVPSPLTPAQQTLAAKLIGWWTRFAPTGTRARLGPPTNPAAAPRCRSPSPGPP